MLHDHEQWLNFNVDLDHESGNILKNGIYQRILLVLKYPQRMGGKNVLFFKTLLDSPMNWGYCYNRAIFDFVSASSFKLFEPNFSWGGLVRQNDD